MIFIEDQEVATSGKVCWDILRALCGWLMSVSKEVWPAQLFCVIGVSVDLRPFLGGDPSIMVTRRRLESLRTLFWAILETTPVRVW